MEIYLNVLSILLDFFIVCFIILAVIKIIRLIFEERMMRKIKKWAAKQLIFELTRNTYQEDDFRRMVLNFYPHLKRKQLQEVMGYVNSLRVK